MRCMCASGEGRVRAKRKEGKRMTLRTMYAGEGMLWGGQGSGRRWRVVFDDGICICRCRTRCTDGQDPHRTNVHGWDELGHWCGELVHCAGPGGVGATADVQEMGGKRGEDDDLRAGLQGTPNHPDRLLVGGLLGPRRGGARGEQRAEPRRKSSGAPPLMRRFNSLHSIDWHRLVFI